MVNDVEIKKIFAGFNNMKVLIIGDVMIDSYLWGKVERISPEAPVPIVAVNKRENRPGGAANVALNVQSLGAEAILCSVIGNDSKGAEFFDLLNKIKLTDEGIIKSEDRITTVKFRIIGNNSQMLRVDEEVNHDLSKKESNELVKRISQIVSTRKIDVIIIEDYNKGIITEDIISKVVSLANTNDIPIAVDPKKNNFNTFENITLLKPNLKELKEGLKIDLPKIDKKSLDNVIGALQQKKKISNMLVTLSEQGIYLSHRNFQNPGNECSYLVSAHIRNIADVSGAGDTVISVAALCLAMKTDPLFLATVSNLAGGLVCEHLGAVPINKELLITETCKLFST